jgi:hypothetical protein
MGILEARMRKLMDGQGAGRPGVAGKVGELAATIRGGGWCEEQGSLMCGLAYGILDPSGERYRLALIHQKSRENDNESYAPSAALTLSTSSGVSDPSASISALLCDGCLLKWPPPLTSNRS